MPGTGGDEGGSRYAYHEGPASWSEAREACQASGGDLAMPRNAADDASAFQVARGKLAYIGLSDRASEGSFVWADGEPVGSYTHWASGEPNSFAGSNEDCAAYHFYFESGQWADISCSGVDPNDGDRPIGYVCEVSHMPCPAPPFAHALLHTSLRFLLGQEPRTNGRFVYHSEGKTWDEARATCLREGGDLASIHSAAENAEAYAAIDKEAHAARQDGTDWPGTWIGLNDRASEGTWVWSDESPTDFRNFQANEPNQGSNENCAFFYAGFSNLWADVNCDQKIGFLCRLPAADANRQRQRRLEPAYGPIELSGSCGGFNCFDGAHINGHDITCETDVSEADCVATCCAQAECKGFDYSASDHGMGAGRCCTGHVSRVEGGFEKNGGTYRSCEKDGVTSQESGSSLVYVAEPQDYDGAQATCAARGGALACVGSRAEALGTAWTGDPSEIWIADSAGGSDDDLKLASDSQSMLASCAAGLAEYDGACSQDMYTLGNAKMQELCAASNSTACAEGAPPGWFMETCPTSCGAC